MNIFILVDDPDSWMIPFAKTIKHKLIKIGHNVSLVHDQYEIDICDVAFYLGCTSIVHSEVMKRGNHNIVVHPSDLPKGRGFSPLAWQILEGKNEIPICLFEAAEGADEGDIYLRSTIVLDGTELNDDIKQKQGRVTVELCLKYINEGKSLKGSKQIGEPTYYTRRTAQSSEMDINKTIAEQFNLLRVVDNDRYPAFFIMHGMKYFITIHKNTNPENSIKS